MLSSGDIIGPYTIRERAGQGGMATVYKAWHNGLHRLEALKVPRGAEQSSPDSAYISRLLAEARVAAGLHHPHIVGIHGVSEPLAPIPFFAMDWVEGQDLAQILTQRGAFSLRETTRILEKVASALDYAHGRGVVHRDIKPANILLSEEGDLLVPKVVDFGISRAAEDDEGAGETKLTRSGMIVGTPEYMSPEQAGSGDKVDFRTDIYSLGIVAYEMLCGAPPFTAGSGVSRLSILISQVRDTAPLWEKFPAFPPAAGTAILRALAKTPTDRPASCTEFIAELGAALAPEDADWALQTVPELALAGTKGANNGAANSLTNGADSQIERTPFDAARFERDESATIFERPISLSDTPAPGPAPTLLPQLQGAETALETPLESPTGAVFSLRARLEAAKNEAANNVVPIEATPNDRSRSETVKSSAAKSNVSEKVALKTDVSQNAVSSRPASPARFAPDENLASTGSEPPGANRPEAERESACVAPKFAAENGLHNSRTDSTDSSLTGKSPAETAQSLKPATRATPRLAVVAGMGGVLVGGALVLALFGRGANPPLSNSPASQNGSPQRVAAGISLKSAAASPLTAKIAPPDANSLSVSTRNAASPSTKASAPNAFIEVSPVKAPPTSLPRLRVVKVVRSSPLAFKNTTRRSSQRAAGTQLVMQRGQNGTRQTTLQITYRGEKEVARRTLSQTVTRPPTAQIVIIGTREAASLARSTSPVESRSLRVRPARSRVRQTVVAQAPIRTRKVTKPAPARSIPARSIAKVRSIKARSFQRPRVVREAPLPP